ncbi:MAG: small ribosomal subunit Rsm22 family protein [Chthoniobacterales bacterium]
MSHWSSRDIATLRRLRTVFLEGTAQTGDYWKTPADLELYDRTFGERIGWKWDAVLAELAARDWRPRSRRLVDFGCGSGVAGRRVLGAYSGFEDVHLTDRSRVATRFALDRIVRDHPNLHVRAGDHPEVDSDTLLVVSHVLNELSESDVTTLRRLAQSAGEILWVEAGSHADSRLLVGAIREPLRASHRVIAPCTHRETCGLLAPHNDRHWCHSFAKPPSAIFQTASWSQFSNEISIDLRSLPYSFLAMTQHSEAAGPPPDHSRVIGRPRKYKGYQKVLRCNATGVEDVRFQKRDSRETWDFLTELPADPIYREPSSPTPRIARG